MPFELNQQTVATIAISVIMTYILLYLMGCPCCSHTMQTIRMKSEVMS